MSRYRFIAAEKACYSIALLCRVLGVARSGSYAWQRRGVSARTQADQVLTDPMRSIHEQRRATYGVQRVHAVLRACGVRCGTKRVARLMHQASLVGGARRRRRRTTVADPTHQPAPNRLQRDFTADAPEHLWVGDITYVATWEGWLYLAVLLDAYSRRGWSAGRWPIICAPSSPCKPCRWPSRVASQLRP